MDIKLPLLILTILFVHSVVGGPLKFFSKKATTTPEEQKRVEEEKKRAEELQAFEKNQEIKRKVAAKEEEETQRHISNCEKKENMQLPWCKVIGLR